VDEIDNPEWVEKVVAGLPYAGSSAGLRAITGAPESFAM
jgi:peptidase E